MATRIWEPLDRQSREIRLIELKSGKWDDRITCTLATANLDNKPNYCALSYVWGELTAPKGGVKLGYYDESKKTDVWGDDDEERWITINGHSHQITLNLYYALLRLRAYGIAIPIWIDAICINQSDVDERTHQVGLMQDIYQDTQRVYISLGEIHPSPIRLTAPVVWHHDGETVMWHGPENKPVIWYGDERDMKFLTFFSSIVSDWSGISGYSYGTDHRTDELFHVFCILRLLAGHYHFEEIPYMGAQSRGSHARQLLRVFTHMKYSGWFHRMWTIQEAVLPRECIVQYGHMIAPWSILADAAANYEQHQSVCCRTFDVGNIDYHLSCFADIVRPIRELRQVMPFRESQSHITLPLLLWTFHNRRATDHRDKVFALLGLVTDWNGQDAIRANYRSETPDLYRSLVLDMINRTQSLSILEGDLKGDATEERHLKLPSWIPDWSDPVNKILYRQAHDRTRRTFLFNASEGTQLDMELKGHNVLAVTARMVDTVWTVEGRMSPAEGGYWDLPKEMAFQDQGFPSPLPADTFIRSVVRIQRRWRRGKTQLMSAFKTLCANSVAQSGTNNRYQSSYRRLTDDDNKDIIEWSYLRFYAKVLPTNTPGAFWKTVPYPNERVYALDKSSAAAVENSCFFDTRSYSFMGLGPRATKKGDVVAVLNGGRTPFVMRKVVEDVTGESGATARYELIGSCYVHGIMDGEAVRNPNAPGPETVLLV